MRYDIRHRTTCRYAGDVSVSHQLLHLEPRPTAQQRVQSCTLSVDPRPTVERASIDTHGNHQRSLTIERPHRKLVIEAHSVVDLEPTFVPEATRTPSWEQVVEACRQCRDDSALLAARFGFPSHFTPLDAAIEDFARASFSEGRPVLAAAIELNERIFDGFTFDPKATTVNTMPPEVLRKKRGVCQDFTHLMLACLRSLRLPARYVSGYLLTRPPEGRERLVGADASHAWVSLWIPGSGWIDLDPTNRMLPSVEHITVGWGLDYADTCPVAGVVYGGGEQTLDVAVDVTPL